MLSPDPRLARPYRWAVLAVYVAVMAVQQMLWLNFAPILLHIQQRYGVGELTASSLIMVFPLLYIALSAPAGRMVDERGYRFTVAWGAAATAAFSLLRVFDGSFWMLFAGQVGIAAAQPFVVNGISKLVADWFDEAEGALATGLGTMGMFLGMALGMAATPWLEARMGLSLSMLVFFAVSAAAAAAFFAVARNNRPPEELRSKDGDAHFGPVFRVPGMKALLGTSFLGMGAFNGLTTWLEALLEPRGIDAEAAGMVGGVMVVGGIAGAVIVPLLSDRLRRRKPFLAGCAAASTGLMALIGVLGSYGALLGDGVALGFVLLPAFAFLLDMSAQLAGAERAGAATGLIMLSGNAGGVVVILLVPAVRALGGGIAPAIALLAGLLAAATALALASPETYQAPAEAAPKPS